jgi:truncated hemoglobin YjbI
MDGLRRLAAAWHARVLADEVVSHAFQQGFHPQHTGRLAAYWAEALGGPRAYSGVYGDETSVVRIHSGNGPHDEMDRRAIARFDEALIEVAWPTTTGCAGRCTITSPGRPQRRWAATPDPPTTSRTACRSPAGRGMDCSTRPPVNRPPSPAEPPGRTGYDVRDREP